MTGAAQVLEDKFSMIWLVVGFLLCLTTPAGAQNTNGFVWCYHEPTCNDTTWPINVPQFCNGSRQSPIDITDPDNITQDGNLTAFTFTNYGNNMIFDKIENTGRTVKVGFKSGVQVSGGNLPEVYDSLQFHLHWGNGSSVPGSEHTVNGKRYPMEFHIVSIKNRYNGNTTQAVADSEGAAALGFFIEADTTTTGQPASWKTLVDFLANITLSGQSANMSDAGISLFDLLPGVNFTKYYRYLGSLTTPLCYEAVIWTVFNDTVKVSSDLINKFSTTLHVGNTNTTPLMINVYRGIQSNVLPLTKSFSSGSDSKLTCSFWLFLLMAALWMR